MEITLDELLAMPLADVLSFAEDSTPMLIRVKAEDGAMRTLFLVSGAAQCEKFEALAEVFFETAGPEAPSNRN